MMDGEWEEVWPNGAKEVLSPTHFIETQNLGQRNSMEAFQRASTWTEHRMTVEKIQASNEKFSNYLSSANLHLNAV